MAQTQLAERIAEEIFRMIERERRIIKADLVEAAERVLKMEGPPVVTKEALQKVTTTNGVQIQSVNFVGAGGGLGSGGLGPLDSTPWYKWGL